MLFSCLAAPETHCEPTLNQAAPPNIMLHYESLVTLPALLLASRRYHACFDLVAVVAADAPAPSCANNRAHRRPCLEYSTTVGSHAAFATAASCQQPATVAGSNTVSGAYGTNLNERAGVLRLCGLVERQRLQIRKRRRPNVELFNI